MSETLAAIGGLWPLALIVLLFVGMLIFRRQLAALLERFHLRIECGSCATTVPVHSGEDLGPGLLRSIERDLEPCLGKGWLKKL